MTIRPYGLKVWQLIGLFTLYLAFVLGLLASAAWVVVQVLKATGVIG